MSSISTGNRTGLRGAVDRTGEGQGGETNKLLIQTASPLSLVHISIPVLGMEPNTLAHAWQSLSLLSYMFSPHTVRGQVRKVGQKKDDIQGGAREPPPQGSADPMLGGSQEDSALQL